MTTFMLFEPQKGPDVLGTIDDFSSHKDLEQEKYEAYKLAHPIDPNNYNVTAHHELGDWTRKLIRTRKGIQRYSNCDVSIWSAF